MERTAQRRAEFKRKIDAMENALAGLANAGFAADIPTIHRFTDGMYIREIHAPAGTIFTSVTHKTQHPFVISAGVCDIVNEFGEVNRFAAPHTGITEPGTRRVFMVYEDLVLTTFHATNITDPDEWVRENTILENNLLPSGFVPQALTNRKEYPCPA